MANGRVLSMMLSVNHCTCTICGAQEFRPGFLGRMTNGLPPECAACGCLERHRIVRALYERVRPLLSQWSALQFAPDASTDAKWFRQFRGAVYGSATAVDMMDTGLPDASFDIVISNHVLEHVSDDTKALREMLRIVGSKGIIHLTVPSPLWRWETVDWGFADPDRNLHYRDYGADFASYVLRRLSGCQALSVTTSDPVTGIADILYLFSAHEERLAALGAVWQRLPVAVVRHI